MPKSKYPTQLDTSIEIPVVRDNILEIGSDALNSIRSAIFQIERTLGINPQGAVGNTVADRLNKVVDGNGNILKEALSRANIVSGPISDSDISKTAAISETKLNLNFPTQLLQDEISYINSQIDKVIALVDEINITLSAHINPFAINRHPATAISVEGVDVIPSDEGTRLLVDGSVQSTFELLYNAHINYTGSAISDENNSHLANQIFFDTSGSISSMTDADDVQEVVEDLAASMLNFEINHQDLFHSNGILRFGRSEDSASSGDGVEIYSEVGVGFVKTTFDGHKISKITMFDTADSIDFNPERSDVVSVSDGDLEKEMQIESIALSLDGSEIDSINVFGEFVGDSTDAAVINVVRNINQKVKNSGLLCTAGEVADDTSSYIIRVANPNSVSIISSGLNPEAFTSSVRYISLSIDDGVNISIDLYEASEARQTIDTVVARINEQAVERHWDILAYRVDIENVTSEIAIVHNLPDTDIFSHTLKVKRSPLDNAIDSAGFAYIEDKEIVAEFGTDYYIQGRSYNGLREKILTFDISFTAGERIIYAGSSAINFEESGLSVGDTVTISGSSDDDGSYMVTGVREDQIELDIGQLPSGFTSPSSLGETYLFCYDNNLSLVNFNFDAISTTFGAMLFDVFMDIDQRIFAAKRLEYSVVNFSSQSLVEIVDFDGELKNDDAMNLSVYNDPIDGELYASLDGGDSIRITGMNSDVYLLSGARNIKLKILFKDEGLINGYIAANGDISTDIFCYSPINIDYNLLLSRVAFGNFKGRVIGGHGANSTRSISKLERGTVGVKDIGTSVKHRLLEQPIYDTRSNGVIHGLGVSNIQKTTVDGFHFYTFDLERGVAYVMGERFELESATIITDIPSDGSVDKFFIFIDEYGNVRFEKADPACSSPTGDSEICMLAVMEDDGVTANAIDLRLFINDLDLKVLNSITVSPEPGMGHFSEIGPAIKYAKRFSEVFPNAGVPTVHLKSGIHKVVLNLGIDYADYSLLSQEEANLLHNQVASDAGFYINFPVNIIGEGHSTVLDAKLMWSDYGDSDDDRTGVTSLQDTGLFIAGPGLDSSITPSGNTDLLTEGIVRLSNFRLRLTGVFPVCNITEDSDGNKPNYGIKLDNLTFDYSERVSFSTTAYAVYTGTLWPSSIDNLGNISIVGCNFLGAAITIGHDADEVRNVNIIDNIFKGSGDGTVDGGDASYYAIRCQAAGHIFSVIDCPLENNVNIVGNINADNDGTNIGYIDAGGDYPWGDRVSRNFIVGGSVGIGTSTPDELLHVHSEAGSARIKISTDPDNSDETLNPGIILEQDGGITVGEVRLEATAGTSYSNSRGNALCLNKLDTAGNSSTLQLGVNNTMVLTVRDNQTHKSVGIRTTTPTRALDVDNGTTRSTVFYSNSIAGVGGVSDLRSINMAAGENGDSHSRLFISDADGDQDMVNINTSYIAPCVGFFGCTKHGNAHIQTAITAIIAYQPALTLSDDIQTSAITASGLVQALIWGQFLGEDNPDDGMNLIVGTGASGDVFYRVSGDGGGAYSVTNSFTGSHDTVCPKRGLSSGLIVESTGEVWGKLAAGSGGGQYDVGLPKTRISKTNGSRTVFGVTGIDLKEGILIEDDSDAAELYKSVPNPNFGKALQGCFSGYAKNFGVKDNEMHISVMALGEGVVWVTNINGEIQNGDYIESSIIPGHGRLQDDDIMRSRTVAKCTESIDWNSITDTIEYEGKLYKKHLTCATFHCG